MAIRSPGYTSVSVDPANPLEEELLDGELLDAVIPDPTAILGQRLKRWMKETFSPGTGWSWRDAVLGDVATSMLAANVTTPAGENAISIADGGQLSPSTSGLDAFAHSNLVIFGAFKLPTDQLGTFNVCLNYDVDTKWNLYVGSDHKLHFFAGTSPSGEAVSDATLRDDLWHTFVAVYNATGTPRGRLYIDGVLQTATQTAGGTFTPTANGLTFGYYAGANTTGSPVQMASFGIGLGAANSGVVTTAEIAALHTYLDSYITVPLVGLAARVLTGRWGKSFTALPWLGLASAGTSLNRQLTALDTTSMLMGMNLSGFSDRGGFYHPSGGAEMTLAKQGVDYYRAKGINFFRFPIWWDRLQPTLNGAFSATVWSEVQELVDYALASGATVMINNHCMAQRSIAGTTRFLGDAQLPYSSLSDFWTRMVSKYGANTNVWFDLINEPDSMPSNGYATPTDALVACYNLVIADLRTAGAVNRIVLEGNGYNNAQHFDSNPYYNNNGNAGPTSGAAFQAGIVDSLNNWIVSCHNYPDAAHGSGGNAVDGTILRTRFQEVMDWAVANDRMVMCGEYSVVAADPVGIGVTQDYLTWLRDSGRVVAACWWTGRHSSWGASSLQIEWNASPEDTRWTWLSPYLTP